MQIGQRFGCHATRILIWVVLAGVAHGTTQTQSGKLTADERHELIDLHCKLRQGKVVLGVVDKLGEVPKRQPVL